MIYLNGRSYPENLAQEAKLAATIAITDKEDSFLYQTAKFIEEFYNNKDYVEVLTSGSTGKPKEIRAEKRKMLASAAMTVTFLNLKKGDSALLCMPLEHIAGKMVVVRSLYQKLNLIVRKPCANLFADAPLNLNFAAITPMQAFCALSEEKSTKILASCQKIIIGGGFIDQELHTKLCNLPCEIYHSYGMTETLSHIALKRISTENKAFKPLPGVSVSLSERKTLIIKAPKICSETLETNDIAQINESGFIIKGRIDNIINSGGIKLIPEEIEEKLSAVIKTPIAVTARKSLKFGEEAILISEKPLDEKLINNAYLTLNKYEKPKAIIVSKIPLTATQKIDRFKLKAMFY